MPPLHPPASRSPPPPDPSAATAAVPSPALLARGTTAAAATPSSVLRQRRGGRSAAPPSAGAAADDADRAARGRRREGGDGLLRPPPPPPGGPTATRGGGGGTAKDAEPPVAERSRRGPVVRAIAPLAIVGGTVSVYSSAIKHSALKNPDAGLTPVSIAYLLLLALNYAIMPRLSKRHIHPSADQRSVALAEEVVKMGLGAGGWILAGRRLASSASSSAVTSAGRPIVATASVLADQLKGWSPSSTLAAAGVPSALYALQGYLTYVAYQNLDAVTYNGLTQLKVLSAALCCYVVLGTKQSGAQLVALGLLTISAAVFQGDWRAWMALARRKVDGRDGDDLPKGKGRSSAGDASEDRGKRLLRGVLPCLAATLLSGLAGAFSQRSLRTAVGGMERDAYFYTAEISFLSAACLVLSVATERLRERLRPGRGGRGTTEAEDSDGRRDDDVRPRFFRHWTRATLLPVVAKATAGLLTALVHRHLGSVVKGFALVLGLVFSALLRFVAEGKELTTGQVVGTALVLLSSWLHFAHPP